MAHLYQVLTMDDEDPAANIIFCNVSSPPCDIQHTAVWQPVWVGPACKHRWLHIYEQGALNYRNSNNFISQSNLVINAVACNREILDLKFSAQNTLRPIIGFSDMAALNFPPFQSVKSDIGCW